MITIITILALLLSISGSNVVNAQELKSEVTIRYYLDYSSMTSKLALSASNNNFIEDDKIEFMIGVFNKDVVENEYFIKETIYRYNFSKTITLNNITPGETRTLVVRAITPNDKQNPMKMIYFDIYGFPATTSQVINNLNYKFSYYTEIKGKENSQEYSNEQIDFSNLLNLNNLIDSRKTNFSNWNYKYSSEGKTGYRYAESANLYFNKGFEWSALEYVENKGYKFPLTFTSNSSGYVYYQLKDIYQDPVTKLYYNSKINDSLVKVEEIEFPKINGEISGLLEIDKQGLNQINYSFPFTFTLDNVPNKEVVDVSEVCEKARYCIERYSDALNLSNYTKYKVGG